MRDNTQLTSSLFFGVSICKKNQTRSSFIREILPIKESRNLAGWAYFAWEIDLETDFEQLEGKPIRTTFNSPF